MENFKYETIKESEKSIFAKVPYFEVTSEYKKAHKQLFYECWIPKNVIENGSAKYFVIRKRNERRLTNPYQKLSCMPNSWNTLGEYAPVKIAEKVDVIDEEKRMELIRFYENKYGSKLRTLINDERGINGDVTEEDYAVIEDLMFPNIEKPNTPKKQLTLYK